MPPYKVFTPYIKTKEITEGYTKQENFNCLSTKIQGYVCQTKRLKFFIYKNTIKLCHKRKNSISR